MDKPHKVIHTASSFCLPRTLALSTDLDCKVSMAWHTNTHSKMQEMHTRKVCVNIKNNRARKRREPKCWLSLLRREFYELGEEKIKPVALHRRRVFFSLQCKHENVSFQKDCDKWMFQSSYARISRKLWCNANCYQVNKLSSSFFVK